MEIKFIEIRDSGTCIPVMATLMLSHEDVGRAFMERSGFVATNPSVLLTKLSSGESHFDWEGWGGGSRTISLCHQHIALHWDEIVSGQVVDWRVLAAEAPPGSEPSREVYVGRLPEVAQPARRLHTYGPSRVGHGFLQCTNCMMTALESSVLGPYCPG